MAEHSRSRAAQSAGDRADLPVVRGEPASAGAASERSQDHPQSIDGTPGMSSRPGMCRPNEGPGAGEGGSSARWGG